jgi:hypothetical protein
MCWFNNLKVTDTRGKSGPKMSLQAYSESGSWKKQADFLDDVENDESFFQDFGKIAPPGGVIAKQESRTPPEAISFRLDLQMRHPKQWVANNKKK